MCGGNLDVSPEMTVGTCSYCGTTMTLPKLSGEKRANLYNRANACRQDNDYDRAMGIYESILAEDLTDAEAYWSLVLCKYGIEYVEDPKTRKRIPTCNRVRTASVFDDHDYRQAIVYASGEAKALYEEEAATIETVRKNILDISNSEEPFDVFICYKETDERGRRTPDSVIAQELYGELTEKGYNVFFSRITLEDKTGTAYEPYIFAALNSAKVMAVIGTRREYFDSVWVKNEWSRYLALIKGGAKKTLAPVYQNMTVGDLPEELRHLQAQDMGELGFMQDLVRGIEKMIPKKKETAPVASSIFWDGTQGVVWQGTELTIDKTSKTVLGIAGAPGSHIVITPDIEAIEPKAFMNIGEITSVIFEQGKLQSIPEYAFAGCKNLKLLILSDNITSVGNNAFEDCGIEAISLPSRLISIGDRAFAGCGALDSVYFHESLKSLGNEAFAGCNTLKQAAFTNLNTIGERAFADCPKLSGIIFVNDRMTGISRSAFAGCVSLDDIVFLERLKTIEEDAFAGCVNIKKLEFGDGLRTVKTNAFAGCTKLRSVSFPEHFSRVEEGAFTGCTALESIIISGKATVAPGAFEGCTKIKAIKIEGKKLKSLLWLASFYENKTVKVTFSDNVEMICDEAFAGCEFLTPVKISRNVKNIGKKAFAGLVGIGKITIPSSVTLIDEGAFAECTELKVITFESRSEVQTIGDRAFAGCTQLKKIEIPDSVQSIGADAFAGCDNLKIIYITENSTIGKLYKDKKITINHPAVTFSRDDVERLNKSVHTTITLSSKDREIKARAFRFYSGIKSVKIPDSVEFINDEAFEGCTGLESLVIPNTVKTIGKEAFSGCTGLREVVVPVKSLHRDGIFMGCSGLKKITFSDDPTSVLDAIHIPSNTFMGCTDLESIIFPATDAVIFSDEAFAGCTTLKEVIFQGPAKRNAITDYRIPAAFANTPFLERYKIERERRIKGLCIHCGGKLNFFKTKCKACGEIHKKTESLSTETDTNVKKTAYSMLIVIIISVMMYLLAIRLIWTFHFLI
jgi:hypothetical protein